ncbi:putative zinc finger protein 862-like [Xyrichtys novacula]|uniref:Zinc finger protein 862-like n=1 Tax=Xyrichtys novacula TaxID=13765 RepID=A0AAV1EI68_XYRNO|nr:putative zinc finger protein 862-like [Xyrichtys novacula]
MEDQAKILDEDTLSFRPLSKVRWLSQHQAVNAVLRNYTVLDEYCKREFRDSKSQRGDEDLIN